MNGRIESPGSHVGVAPLRPDGNRVCQLTSLACLTVVSFASCRTGAGSQIAGQTRGSSRATERAPNGSLKRSRTVKEKAIVVGADVSRTADVARLFAAVDAAVGRVDVLVNNAGIFRGRHLRGRDRVRAGGEDTPRPTGTRGWIARCLRCFWHPTNRRGSPVRSFALQVESSSGLSQTSCNLIRMDAT